MEMSMNVLAMFVANALKLKDDKRKSNLLKEYEKNFPQTSGGIWWGDETYKHVITTIMARVNTPFFSKNSLSAMAKNLPLLVGIHLSINDNDDKEEVQKLNALVNKHKKLHGEEEKNNKKVLKEMIIKDIRNNECRFFKQDEDINPNMNVTIIKGINDAFNTYYDSKNTNNNKFTYDNVKEVIALFTNYYNLVDYLFRNSDNKTNFVYPFICPDLDEEKKTIVLFETNDLDKLLENLNEFIKYCRFHYYPLIVSKNEE